MVIDVRVNNKDDMQERKKRKLSNVKRDSSYQAVLRKRELGLPYKGNKKQDGNWDYKGEKPGKLMSKPCNCNLSGRKIVLQYRRLNEE